MQETKQWLLMPLALGVLFTFSAQAAASPNDEYLRGIEDKVRAELGGPEQPPLCDTGSSIDKLNCIAARQTHRMKWLAAFHEKVAAGFHWEDNRQVSKVLKNENGEPMTTEEMGAVLAPHLAHIDVAARNDGETATALLKDLAEGPEKDAVYATLLESYNLPHPGLAPPLEQILRDLHGKLNVCHPFLVNGKPVEDDAPIKAASPGVFEFWISCIDDAGKKAMEDGSKTVQSFSKRGFNSGREDQLVFNFRNMADQLSRDAMEQAVVAQAKNKELNKKTGCDAECVRKSQEAAARLGLATPSKFNQAQYDTIVQCARDNAPIRALNDEINEMKRANRRLKQRYEELRRGSSRRNSMIREYNANNAEINALVRKYNRDGDALMARCGTVKNTKATAEAACKVAGVAYTFPTMCD